MTKQTQESMKIRIWVDEFDEEDWQQLFLLDSEEGYENGKAFLRSN